jgi:antitoxin (DNA-binding transcriptional repressor) of toxin-antitoxin stability system
LEVIVSQKSLSTTAREAVHNFSHYAALVESGTEVVITRRGRASLRLVLAEPSVSPKDRTEMIQRALAFRSSAPFKGKFDRHEAYDE